MSSTTNQLRITEWFSRWQSPLRRFLAGRRGIPVADLDDVAQEVFLRLMRYSRSELVEHPQAYLFKIASNVSSEWIVRGRHRYAPEPEWLSELPAEDHPEENIARTEAEQQIHAAIQRLPARHRAIIKLKFLEGMDQVQIAKYLQVSERIVKRDLAKTYARLRMELNMDLLGMLTHGRE